MENDTKTQRYSHQYQDCLGEGCDKKSDCIHHLAYIEASEQKIETKHFEHCENADLQYVKVHIEKS